MAWSVTSMHRVGMENVSVNKDSPVRLTYIILYVHFYIMTATFLLTTLTLT